jgi:F like protein
MNARDYQLWQRFQYRVRLLSPDLAKALLDAFDVIRQSLTEAELERLLNGEDSLLDRAFIPVRDQIKAAVSQGFRVTIPQLPKAGKINGTVAVNFDTLNPRVIDAIRQLDSRVINTLKQEIRETVKAYTENALRDGVGPRALARDLKPIIGLAPNQNEAVNNFRKALEGTNPNASPTDYKLRDRRFDAALRKGNLSESQIETMTNAYRRKMLTFNATTNARTTTLDAMKLGQKLSWDDAITKGLVEKGTLIKRWSGVMDDRERPEHVAMQGETIPYDSVFSNGEDIPGSSTFNCRCLAIVRVSTSTDPS